LTITSRTALNDRNKAASLAEPRKHQIAPQKKALQHPWRRKNRHCSLLVCQSVHPVDKIVDNRWIGCGKPVCTGRLARRQKRAIRMSLMPVWRFDPARPVIPTG
jgi:hypothetical protein